jgi:hypothetical protein
LPRSPGNPREAPAPVPLRWGLVWLRDMTTHIAVGHLWRGALSAKLRLSEMVSLRNATVGLPPAVRIVLNVFKGGRFMF